MNTNDPQAPYTVKLNGPIEDATAPLIQKYYVGQFGDLVEMTEAQFADWGMDEVVVMWADVQAKIASGELVSRSDALLRHLIEVLDENPMIEDTYPRMTELRAKIIEAETK